MKKYISGILIAAMITFALCACASSGGQTGTSGKNEAASAQETAEMAAEAEAVTEEAEEEPAGEAAEMAAAEAATQAAAVSSDEKTDGQEVSQTDSQTDGQTDAQPDSQTDGRPESTALPMFVLNSFSDAEYADDSTIALGSYQTIALTQEAAEAYPSLRQALAAISTEISGQEDESYWEIVDAARTMRDEYEGDDSELPPGEVTMTIEPVRCDSSVLSFYNTCYTYYPGAAHGMTGYKSYNYDPASGQPIALADVFTDPAALVPAVEENLIAISDGTPITGVHDAVTMFFDENAEYLNWVIDQDGVTFRFSPSDITSYAAGTLEARIPFAGYPELFTGRFSPSVGAYAKTLSPYHQTAVDLDGDGEAAMLSVEPVSDEGGDLYSYTKIRVNVGEQSCESENWFYNMSSVLVHTDDGRNYIYTETTSDNDYESLTVFAIVDGIPAEVGRMDGTGFASIWQDIHEDGKYNSYVEITPVLDPSHMTFDTRLNLMSTYSGTRLYEVGADGMPSPLTDYYVIHSGVELTCKRPMEVEIVDTQTGEGTGETDTIAAGTVCSLWHTDGDSYVDLMLEDGRAVRVNASSEWPQTVNGIKLEDAFDGTMFAG